MVDIPVRETTPGATLQELKLHESRPLQRKDMLSGLGYRVVEDVVSNKLFTDTFQAEFQQIAKRKGEDPRNIANRAQNPDELRPEVRAQIKPPTCTTVETAEGERLWAISFGDRMTVVIDSHPRPFSIDGQNQGNVYAMRNVLLSQRSGSGGHMIDLLPYLHEYERRWGREATEAYLSLGFTDPQFFPEQEDQPAAFVLPLAIRRERERPAIDPEETVNRIIHEGSHAARRHIDKTLSVEHQIAPTEKGADLAREMVGTTVKERGAHAIGLLLAHKLRKYIDVRSYRKSMHASLESYDRNFPRERAKIGRAAYALSSHRIAAGK